MEIDKLQKYYENNVKNIELNLKKKNFNQYNSNQYNFNQNNINLNNTIKINAYDDMFYEMYLKKKYINNFDKKMLNIEYKITGNIIKDISLLLTYFNNSYLHSEYFKISRYGDKNYFTPNSLDEIFLYNSIDNITYKQSDFRHQLWYIENIINNKILSKYTNYTITNDFYEDEKFDFIWIIYKLKKNDI
jgi:hypothetical protein